MRIRPFLSVVAAFALTLSVPGTASAADNYRLVSSQRSTTVSTPGGHTFDVNITYPRLIGGKADARTSFNNAVAAEIARIEAEQASSVDSGGSCPNADLTGDWSGRKIIKKHYVSVMLSYDGGDCGGVAWGAAFGSVTFSLKSGKTHDLTYMLGKFAGRPPTTFTSDRARAYREGIAFWADAMAQTPCVDTGLISEAVPDGWRVSTKGLTAAYEKYVIGPGACGTPALAIPWRDYRMAVKASQSYT